MSDQWQSLYLLADDAASVTAALLKVSAQQGYRRYDPFPGGSGTPPGLKTFIKHFVAPANGGWVRILGDPDPNILADLSAAYPVLHARITATEGRIDAYHDGQPGDLSVYLANSKTPADLKRIRQGILPPTVLPKQAKPATAEALPDELQQLARDRSVNVDQANKLVNRLTANLFGKMDRASSGEASAMQNQARQMLHRTTVDWTSAPGRQLVALVTMLTLPANWRDPAFEALRDAYQAARMLDKNPRAQLMDDEKSALRGVPDAIAYQAVYLGK